MYVFRHNTVKNNIAGNTAHAIDAHEARLDGSGNNYSTRAIEVYGNSIINTMFKDGTDNCPDGTPIVAGKDPSWLVESAITTRGGEALIFNNYIEGYRFGVGLVANLEFQGPYPIAYQQGYLSGLKYGATHTGVDGDKGDGDNFVWDDSYKSYAPTNKNCVYFYNYSKTDLKEGRDYHLFAKPNYVPYTYPHPLCSSSNPTNTLVLTTSSTTASCINVNGTASVVVKGGNPGVTGYTYSWSTVPVKTTATATGLPSGTYTVTIKDADGNYKMASVLVKKAATPFNLSTVVTSASCNTCADGTVDVLVSGGKSTYSFKWDSQSKSSFSTSSYLTGLAVGSYSVTATDLDGCYKQVTTKISTSVTGIDEANSDKGSMLISPNPSSGKFNISNTNFKENESVSIVLYTIEGKEAFATLATNAGNIISIDAEGRLEAGVYILMAKSPDLILRKSLLITH